MEEAPLYVVVAAPFPLRGRRIQFQNGRRYCQSRGLRILTARMRPSRIREYQPRHPHPSGCSLQVPDI